MSEPRGELAEVDFAKEQERPVEERRRAAFRGPRGCRGSPPRPEPRAQEAPPWHGSARGAPGPVAAPAIVQARVAAARPRGQGSSAIRPEPAPRASGSPPRGGYVPACQECSSSSRRPRAWPRDERRTCAEAHMLSFSPSSRPAAPASARAEAWTARMTRSVSAPAVPQVERSGLRRGAGFGYEMATSGARCARTLRFVTRHQGRTGRSAGAPRARRSPCPGGSTLRVWVPPVL